MTIKTKGQKNSKLKDISKGAVKASFVLAMGAFLFFAFGAQKAEAAWNKSYIISDEAFTAKSSMSEAQIQAFLVRKGSYLASYKETRWNKIGTPERVQAHGKSAAYIINWVAKEYGISPQVILVTLQKEQSLVTNPSKNQYGLDWAMGYGVPDSGSRDYNKRGFSRQVDWGTYQFKFNRDHAISTSSTERAQVWPYIKGTTITIDGVRTYLGNGATASLYRYTPHFHGNQNFDLDYSSWFNPYNYSFVSAVNPPRWMSVGQVASVNIKIKNTGATTWKNDSQGSSTPMRLNIVSGNSFCTATGWTPGCTRVKMTTATVAPGQTGTFNFTIKAPNLPGERLIKMVPIIENIKNLRDAGMMFAMFIPGKVSTYQFWSGVNTDHFYTISQAQKSRLILNYPDNVWKYQGISFASYNYQASGTTPIYQLWSAKYGDHYYTANLKQKQSLSASKTWKYQGIAFYTYKSNTSGTKPVYQFWSAKYGDHYYTANWYEKQRLIANYPDNVWKYQGVVFYVSK